MKGKFAIDKKSIFNLGTFIDLLAATVGSALWVIAVDAIVIPNDLLSGGLTGIAILINYILPFLPVSVLIYVFNMPLLIWAWRDINPRFILYTVYAVTIQSIFLETFKNMPSYTGDTMLACLFGGLCAGIGAGLIIRYHGSSGGSDVIGIVIKKRYGYSVGTVGTILNAVIVGLSAIYGLEIAMYTFIFIAVCNIATDKTIEGLSKRYTAIIISEKPEEMKNEIFQRVHRGVTFLDGRGAFSGVRRQIIYCVVNQYELATLKDIIREVDANAFMALSETNEVYGYFYKKGTKNKTNLKELENKVLEDVLAPRTANEVLEAKGKGITEKAPEEQSPR